MAKADSIVPFPAHIDREAFGNWLSGFADGESSFLLTIAIGKQGRTVPTLHANFRIALRSDDGDTLRLIQSFWGCGVLSFFDNRRCKIPNAKPIAVYAVQAIPGLAEIVVPHFERFPLRSKKAADFAIWKEGIVLLDTIRRRPLQFRPGDGIKPGHGGAIPKWTEAELIRFLSLKDALQKQRVFADSLSPIDPDQHFELSRAG
jgi:hypothetical protein